MPAYLLLWLPLIVYYLLGFAGLVYEPVYEFSLRALNSGTARNPSESALIEHLEALLWLSAFAIYLLVALRTKLQAKRSFWYFAFAALCFLAFGEEISWGQHYLNFATPEAVLKFNNQGELNFHNLHLSELLGISPNNPLYSKFGTLTAVLNPAFYALSIFSWLLFPIYLERSKNSYVASIFGAYPRQSTAFYMSFAFFIALYLIVDILVFDVGELFELTVATVGCMTAWIQMKKRSA